ncbi:MAG: branched-chain amino acid transaminase [Alphaproteobacteria bacterium]|nr:branched-chain amino acid transaminase [Alphaproteobacteria bacterium]MCB9700173.1 branched-chain amino acid transaminase [Alphaproteobacteria bacterium]
MGIESQWIWMDGELVPFADARVHVLAHTLHYGLGAFEGIRAYEQPDGRAGIWRLDEHIERLFDSLKMARMTPSCSREDIKRACLDVLTRNGFTEAYIRPLAFMGMGAMGLGARNNPVHMVVAAWKWGAYLGDEGMKNGVRLRTSSFSRNHPNAALSRAKIVGHYVNSIMARYEANDDGFEEALMLDHLGFVAEGTGENVFVIKGGLVKTPPVANILPGITRKTVMDILDHEGIPLKEQLFGRDAFYVAEEAFMCGTAAEVTPIASLDRRAVGEGRPGPMTQRIQQIYADGVRGRIDWLSEQITVAG